MSSIAQTYWTYTCKFCDVVRKALLTAFMAIIAFGESAGRARAARELAHMGRYEEAKSLMLREDEKHVQLERPFKRYDRPNFNDVYTWRTYGTQRTSLCRGAIMWPYTDEETDFINGK